MIKVILPLNIVYGYNKKDQKDRVFSINLNDYRNKGTCFFIMNKVKQMYHEAMKAQIDKLPKLKPPIRCDYIVYKRDKRAFDVNNVCSVADKFLMDAIVEYGKLEDDNYNYYLGFGKTSFGGVDKENPRIEVIIHEEVKE